MLCRRRWNYSYHFALNLLPHYLAVYICQTYLKKKIIKAVKFFVHNVESTQRMQTSPWLTKKVSNAIDQQNVDIG